MMGMMALGVVYRDPNVKQVDVRRFVIWVSIGLLGREGGRG